METLAIKVKIGDREYPMRVKPEDEGKIRHAGRMINEKLKKYKSEFGLDDSTGTCALFYKQTKSVRNIWSTYKGANVSRVVNGISVLISIGRGCSVSRYACRSVSP